MHILAHRGFWRRPEEKNTRTAFLDAFRGGYGVELDVRDSLGELVISHDPPLAGCMSFAQVLDDYLSVSATGWIAINVKADGLAKPIGELVESKGLLDQCFVFDMSVPDMLAYTRSSLRVFTRRSEYEVRPALLERSVGVWEDAFEKEGPDLDQIIADLAAGKCVAIVSPELHKRPHLGYWAQARDLLAAADKAGDPDSVMLCTDFPDEAAAYFAAWSR